MLVRAIVLIAVSAFGASTAPVGAAAGEKGVSEETGSGAAGLLRLPGDASRTAASLDSRGGAAALRARQPSAPRPRHHPTQGWRIDGRCGVS